MDYDIREEWSINITRDKDYMYFIGNHFILKEK